LVFDYSLLQGVTLADSNLRAYVAGLAASVPTRHGSRPYVNLDNAASTPPLRSVLKTVNDFVPWYASVHRGNGFKSRLSTQAYEDARGIVGRFVGADPAEHVVIFGKNTTEAINKLSFRLRLRKKDVVLMGHLEHHSNDLPWRAQATVKRIGITPDGGLDQQDFLAQLTANAGKVRLVAITGASNVTGHLPDIHWFAREAHRAGAAIFVDCAQLAAHRPIDMGRLDDPRHIDYIALSAHKMYAPFGTGALIGRRDTFMLGTPEYVGGGTVNLVTSQIVDWAMPPASEEAGSPNVVGAVALARAIKTLERIGLDAIARHETDLTAYALQRLALVPGITLYGDTDPARAVERLCVVPFNLAGKSPHLVASILGYEWGIGVRSGCFCAHPYVMTLLGLSMAERHRIRYDMLHARHDRLPGMVRMSCGLYNTRADIDLLAEALKAIARGEHGQYEVDNVTGQYTPIGHRESFAPFFKI
jgi:selenocysteine lyase/cysteine desulfurase